ncbi:hypothetical protein N499_0632A, partial [Wolbachia pipientis wVitA]
MWRYSSSPQKQKTYLTPFA